MMARILCWAFGHKAKFWHPQQTICLCRRCDRIVTRRGGAA